VNPDDEEVVYRLTWLKLRYLAVALALGAVGWLGLILVIAAVRHWLGW
jgi:hypothetical protein